jgi:hypothetical protein
MFSLKAWLEGAALNYECEKTCDLGWQILGLVGIHAAITVRISTGELHYTKTTCEL